MANERFDYSKFAFNPDDPLDRVVPGESRKANAALRDYVYMGSGRSLRNLFDRYREQVANDPQTRPPTTSLSTLGTWSDRLQWIPRLERFLEIEQERERVEWVERTKRIRESDYNAGEQLRDLFDRIMAESPNFIRTRRRFIRGAIRIVDQNGKIIQEGEPDREVITMQLDVNLLIRALKTGADLQRLSAGLETERVFNETINRVTGLPPVDTESMDDDQLAASLREQSELNKELARRIESRIQPESRDLSSDTT